MPKSLKEASIIRMSQGELVKLVESDSEEELTSFRMVAYTGKEVETMMGRMVFSISGMRIGKIEKPILRNHSVQQIVGHSTEITKNGAVRVSGVVSGASDEARQVEESGKNNFPWQSSVGISVHKLKELGEEDEMRVNGQLTKGPITVITDSTLKEVSFVPLGADDDTSAKIVASWDGKDLDLTGNVVDDVNDGDVDVAVTITKISGASAVDNINVAELTDEAKETAAKLTGRQEAMGQLGELQVAFPDRPDFVIKQLGLGHTVEQAKADLLDVVLAEKKETDDKLEKARAQLTEKLNTEDAIIQFDGSADTVASGTSDDSIQPDGSDITKLAEWEWNQNLNGCQGRYRATENCTAKESYMTIRRIEASGMLKVKGDTTVVLDPNA